MDISIKVLTPDMADEYITYFDEKAFSDGSKEKGCYCVWHHWTQQKELDRSALPEAERACYKRNYAYELIKTDKLHGFAAMCGDQMVGFCNADRKDHYFRLNRENNPEIWDGVEADEKVLSIVCYIISPDMRGRGIAKAFLKYTCEYAAENGYDFVIMVKGMKSLVSELVLQVQGGFENDRKNSIRAYRVSGTTVKRKLFATDRKERYFHIYYDDGKKAYERERFEYKEGLN